MAKQLDHRLLISNKYKLSVIIILLLAGFTWMFFSFKILQNKPTIEGKETSIRNKTYSLISTKTITNLQSVVSRSRNRENSLPLNETEKQQYIEALRESFEKVRPTPNNKIIRGEIRPSRKTIVETPPSNIENLVNDELKLKTLNAQYQKALKEIKTTKQ